MGIWDGQFVKMPESDAIALSKNMIIRGIWGHAILKGESQIVNDTTSHPDTVGFPEDHPQIKCFMGVPLKNKGKTIGIIGLANKDGGYEHADQEAVEALSVAFVEALCRKRAEKALRESEERYRVVFERAGDYVLILDVDQGEIPIIMDANEAALSFHGYSRSEMIGKPITMLDPEMTPEMLLERKQLIDTEGGGIISAHHQSKDGTGFDAEAYIQPAQIGAKSVLLSIERDVTKLKRAEEALRKKVAEMDSFINSIPDMAWLKDVNSNFIITNKAFGDAVGMDPEYLANHTCAICFGEEAAKKFKEDDKRVMEVGKQIVIEESITDAKGNKVFLA